LARYIAVESTRNDRPVSGRVSDAGRARAIEPGERPASESLR
jgi:hypothetical protein